MGAYTSGVEVLNLLLSLKPGPPPRFDAADVEELVEGIEAEVNGLLKGQGYEIVPATGPNDMALLGLQVRRKVAVLTYLTLYQPTGRAPDWTRMWDVDYDNFKNALRLGQQHLVDQAPQGENDALFGVVPPLERDDYFTRRR